LVADMLIRAVNYHRHPKKIPKPSKFCINLTKANKFIKLEREIMRKIRACE
jgi:hypothetical protein